ncbi:MAG: hypothetical protein R2749_19995, partial [Acidimicrobiales bacterium]
AVEGHRWCFGHNELSLHFYDRTQRFAHRSIKRRGAAHYTSLWGNTGLSSLGRSTNIDLGARTVNATCRPYHLGWILEAWSGREDRIKLLGDPS